MMRLLPVLMLVGCPKAVELDTPVDSEALSQPPVLPNPRAGTYARVPKKPADPVVRSVIGDRTWDASLGGAAAGLALDAADKAGGFTRREVREAAWQAGYPWPILAMGTWPTTEAGEPPAAMLTWLKNQPADRDIGLVRARGQGKDLWVGLAGKEQIRLGVVPREVPGGTPLSLPARPGAVWRVSDGSGAYREGTLDTGLDLTLDVPGEWVVQIRDDGGDLARFAVYVDETPATVPVLPPNNVAVSSRGSARERVEWLLQRARDEYRNKPFAVSPLLDQAANDALEKGSDPQELAAAMSASPDRAVGARCTAASVEDCIDQLLWDPRTRLPFVDDGKWGAGFELAWTSQKVELVLIFAGE